MKHLSPFEAELARLIADLEAVPDTGEGYWEAVIALEGFENNERVNGRFENADRIFAERNRIHPAVVARINARLEAESPYSQTNWKSNKQRYADKFRAQIAKAGLGDGRAA